MVLYSVLAQFTMMTIITKIMTTMNKTILSTTMISFQLSLSLWSGGRPGAVRQVLRLRDRRQTGAKTLRGLTKILFVIWNIACK